MDFKDQIKQLSERIKKMKDQIATEEATKNALIMPFIQILGYDVFNPMEVVPEMDCDLVKKKGEKIDYAIMKDGEPIILFECKHWQQDLDLHSTQLQKYFVASKAKFGVLTNGIIYRFYTDLAKPNLMDDTPFLEVDMENFKEVQVEELKKFHKSYFDVDNIFSSASELKYMAELKSIIRQEFNSPSTEMVRMLCKRIYEGVITQKVIDQFTDLVKRSFSGHINDVMSERLNIAIKSTEPSNDNQPQAEQPQDQIQSDEKPSVESRIITTEEEVEGYYIVKSILRGYVDADRITYRDTISYFSIICDDNNRKPICRLYFNTANKYIVIVDSDKKDVKYKISCLDDIYQYADDFIKASVRYK